MSNNREDKHAEWLKYRSRFISAYFNDHGLAPADSFLHQEFSTFLSKFQTKAYVFYALARLFSAVLAQYEFVYLIYLGLKAI